MKSGAANVLIVDDEQIVRVSLENWLKADGHFVSSAASGRDALAVINDKPWDILLLDIKMPKMGGIELLQRVKEIKPDAYVVMMTAYASVESAVDAMKKGAYDYLMKPFEPEELRMIITRIMEKRSLERENLSMKRRIDDESPGFEEIVGECTAMKEVFQLVRDVADTESTVLITGESGTGKELVAKAIHANSVRKYMPFVPVSLGALPETLVESELFGHEKGAFTGAVYAKRGRFELADGGTLFLDEIGDVSPKTQVDLLRVLQERKFTRIGGTAEINSDVRIIAATNRPLKDLVGQGKFRDDLFYRLNVVSIHIPPLRERAGDIILLAHRFLKKYATKTSKPVNAFSNEALDILRKYHWPGNVRELENSIERAFVVVKGDTIKSNHLPFSIQGTEGQVNTESLTEVEKHHIRRVLAEYGWNITQAAKALEIDRVTLYNKIKKYDFKEEV